jgi:hypothetical protein
MADLNISADYQDPPILNTMDYHNVSVDPSILVETKENLIRDSVDSNQGGFPMGRRKSAGTLTATRPVKKIQEYQNTTPK